MTSDPNNKVILITGGSGFIGRQMVSFLLERGYSVRVLGRKTDRPGCYTWDPQRGRIDEQALAGVHAVIHLAGESIAGGRWTKRKRRRILESRVKGTRLLVSSLGELAQPPAVLISASGVNAYGLSGKVKTEDSSYGDGFLAEVCQHWETEALRACAFGIRTVCVRTGIVLHESGGALRQLLPLFRLGLGGCVGSGEQGFPWISMSDLVRIYAHAIETESIQGALNAVHPQLIDQATFARTLAKVLRRPLLLPLPAILVHALFGRMGRETLLADLKVSPERLLQHGYTFKEGTLQQALCRLLDVQFT